MAFNAGGRATGHRRLDPLKDRNGQALRAYAAGPESACAGVLVITLASPTWASAFLARVNQQADPARWAWCAAWWWPHQTTCTATVFSENKREFTFQPRGNLDFNIGAPAI